MVRALKFWVDMALTYILKLYYAIKKIFMGNFVDLYPCYLRWRYGMDIGRNCRISWKAHLDKSINPKGIHIGDNTWVLSGAMILAHDHCRSLKS